MLTAAEASQIIGDDLFPKWNTERGRLDRIDRWARWDHEDPHKPRQATTEYKELVARAQAPWGDLIVGSVAQTLYVEGYRRPDQPEDGTGWAIWQANGMDARQVAIHRSTLTYGLTYGTCLPGKTLAGEPMPQMRGVSPRDMIAVYDDPVYDDWPVYALRVSKVRKGWRVQLLDDTAVWSANVGYKGEVPNSESLTQQIHGAGVCPVVRYRNRFDLEGRSSGEVEPFIPLLARIDQTSFDRLVVQRFASWIVRTVAGMDVAKSAETTGETIEAVKLRLAVNDFLTAEDSDTKFGSLPATPLDGFIKAHDSDLSDLAAVSQTPAFELLGQMANLSAEALAAAKASQTAKSDERKHTIGEDHEQFIRLACHLCRRRGGGRRLPRPGPLGGHVDPVPGPSRRRLREARPDARRATPGAAPQDPRLHAAGRRRGPDDHGAGRVHGPAPQRADGRPDLSAGSPSRRLMAATAEARRLTEAHRLSQVRLGTRTAGQILATWPLLDINDLDGTFDRWLRAVLPIIETQHTTSARLAGNYVDLFKKLELGTSARAPIVLAELSRQAVTTSMLVTGPVTVKAAVARGVQVDRAAEIARTKVAGTALRHVLTGGRDTVMDTITADRQALGWARATSGSPCAFCAMVASRGPVYKGEDTAAFQAHDHCMCGSEPLYRSDSAWPAGSERYRSIWNEAKAAEGDTAKNFRHLIEGA